MACHNPAFNMSDFADTTPGKLRAGKGRGRIYTITYTVTEVCGNVTTMSVTVIVPYSR